MSTASPQIARIKCFDGELGVLSVVSEECNGIGVQSVHDDTSMVFPWRVVFACSESLLQRPKAARREKSRDLVESLWREGRRAEGPPGHPTGGREAAPLPAVRRFPSLAGLK